MLSTRVLLKVAEAFGKPWDERSALEQEATRTGLCEAYEVLGGSTECYDFFNDIGTYGYLWSCRPLFATECVWDDVRCLTACLLAAMTSSERRALVRNP